MCVCLCNFMFISLNKNIHSSSCLSERLKRRNVFRAPLLRGSGRGRRRRCLLVDQVLAEELNLLHKERLERFGAPVKLTLLRVVVPAVVEDLGHVADKLRQRVVVLGVHLALDLLEVWKWENILVSKKLLPI